MTSKSAAESGCTTDTSLFQNAFSVLKESSARILAELVFRDTPIREILRGSTCLTCHIVCGEGGPAEAESVHALPPPVSEGRSGGFTEQIAFKCPDCGVVFTRTFIRKEPLLQLLRKHLWA